MTVNKNHMFGKVPLKETKQLLLKDQKSSSVIQKKPTENAKETLKSVNNPASKTPMKKENLPQ